MRNVVRWLCGLLSCLLSWCSSFFSLSYSAFIHNSLHLFFLFFFYHIVLSVLFGCLHLGFLHNFVSNNDLRLMTLNKTVRVMLLSTKKIIIRKRKKRSNSLFRGNQFTSCNHSKTMRPHRSFNADKTIYGWFYSTRFYFITFLVADAIAISHLLFVTTFWSSICRGILQEMYANIFTKIRVLFLSIHRMCVHIYVFAMFLVFHFIYCCMSYVCVRESKLVLVHKLITIITVITGDDVYFAFVWHGITVLRHYCLFSHFQAILS